MKVIFRSKQPYLQVAHEELFHVGVVITSYDVNGKWLGSQAEWEALQKLPDPEMVNNSYCCKGGKTMKNNCKIIQYHIPQKIIIGEEYIDYFMVDMFPGKKIRESNNGKNVRKILELLFQAYEVAGEERKSFLMKMDEVAENMDYTEKINGKRTWITVRDRTREYLPQLFVW